MTIETSKLMVYTKEGPAKEKYKSLMQASVNEIERRQEEVAKQQVKLSDAKKYIQEALDKMHH